MFCGFPPDLDVRIPFPILVEFMLANGFGKPTDAERRLGWSSYEIANESTVALENSLVKSDFSSQALDAVRHGRNSGYRIRHALLFLLTRNEPHGVKWGEIYERSYRKFEAIHDQSFRQGFIRSAREQLGLSNKTADRARELQRLGDQPWEKIKAFLEQSVEVPAQSSCLASQNQRLAKYGGGKKRMENIDKPTERSGLDEVIRKPGNDDSAEPPIANRWNMLESTKIESNGTSLAQESSSGEPVASDLKSTGSGCFDMDMQGNQQMKVSEPVHTRANDQNMKTQTVSEEVEDGARNKTPGFLECMRRRWRKKKLAPIAKAAAQEARGKGEPAMEAAMCAMLEDQAEKIAEKIAKENRNKYLPFKPSLEEYAKALHVEEAGKRAAKEAAWKVLEDDPFLREIAEQASREK